MGIDCGCSAVWGILLPRDKYADLYAELERLATKEEGTLDELCSTLHGRNLVIEAVRATDLISIPDDVDAIVVTDEPPGRTYPLVQQGDIIVGYGTAFRDPRSEPVTVSEEFAELADFYSWPWIG